MATLTLEVPLMYGDHHVTEVRRLLLSLPGVEDVYASSCFHIVEVQYDETQVSPEEIEARLDEAGYLGELPVPVEAGAVYGNGQEGSQEPSYRHTIAYEQTRQMVSFAQRVPYRGRPLWPCPGMGVLRSAETEEEAKVVEVEIATEIATKERR
ncbi:MAG: copper chaperone [Chloroflexi bacterium]|nr:MAG: copper chaperone [Chloroflexota bacterium]